MKPPPFPLMIDSGAFSVKQAERKGLPVVAIDLHTYIDFCHQVAEMHPQAVFVNLDVIGDGRASYRNWIRMRKAGIDALPVYHLGTPEKWLREYLHKTEYVGIGGMRGRDNVRKLALDRLWSNYFTNRQGMPTARIHGMAVTSFKLMARYPWYSVDSTSWLQPSMYGFVLLPRPHGKDWRYWKVPIKLCVTAQSKIAIEQGNHFNNLSANEQTNVLRYLAEYGYVLGTSKWKKGKRRKRRNRDVYTDLHEVVVERGVSNWHRYRSNINCTYYIKFLLGLPWPRSFSMPGLLMEDHRHALDLPTATNPIDIPHTILYLSGDGYPIEAYVEQQRDSLSLAGILLSYNDLRVKQTSYQRLIALRDYNESGSATTLTDPGSGEGGYHVTRIARTKQRIHIHRR